jgi:hypothetical protein
MSANRQRAGKSLRELVLDQFGLLLRAATVMAFWILLSRLGAEITETVIVAVLAAVFGPALLPAGFITVGSVRSADDPAPVDTSSTNQLPATSAERQRAPAVSREPLREARR